MSIKIIILDSFPLSLLAQRHRAVVADACRDWLAAKRRVGIVFVLPEIVDYELRRELLRAGKADSLLRLDNLVTSSTVELLRVNSMALRHAAQLWAAARQRGIPTADPHALDVDVILCAQILSAGFDPADVVVATSNPVHISQFLPAALWNTI